MRITLPFLKKEKIAIDTYAFYFDKTKTQFDFFPGQYIKITLPINSKDGLGASRDFTIASSPLEKKFIMITTKTGNSDFKKKLFDLEPEKNIQMYGPIGGFYIRDDEKFDHVFLAGGIGITPFYSMITYAAEKMLAINITLIVSFSMIQDIIFYEELTTIAKKNKNIKVIYTITSSTHPQALWNGETGKINQKLIKKYVPNIFKPTFYIVGSPQMVDNMEELLKTMNTTEGKIKIEVFTGY